MTPFVVNAPLSLPPEPAWSQVLLRAGDSVEILDLLPRWTAVARVRRLTVPAALPLPAALLASLPPGLRLSVALDRAGPLDPALPAALWDQEVNLWAEPAAESAAAAHEIVTRASLAGWPVHLPPAPWVVKGDEGLLDLLDHYLFRAELVVPVEPFHSLLAIKAQRQRRTLWNVWFGHPEDHFYVDEDEHVSLCAAWAADPVTRYGRASDNTAIWRESAGYRRLLALLDADPASDEACLSCDHHQTCGGVLRALGATSCATWQEILLRLRLVAGRLQRRARPTRSRPEE